MLLKTHMWESYTGQPYAGFTVLDRIMGMLIGKRQMQKAAGISDEYLEVRRKHLLEPLLIPFYEGSKLKEE